MRTIITTKTVLLITAVCVAGAAALQGADNAFKWRVHDMDRPLPTAVTPGDFCTHSAPSDATVLFAGSTTDNLVRFGTDQPILWKVEGDDLVVTPGSGDIATKDSFGDCQFHIEWMVPADRECKGQAGCNSGVFFFSQYEVQIVQGLDNRTYADGIAGSLYGQHPPMVNPCKAKGEWNAYDIIFRAPRFNVDGSVAHAATTTVLFNGIVVQDNTAILGSTAHGQRAKYAKHADRMPIKIQNHGDPLRFRNIWVRELGAQPVAQ
ncbi:MAG: DUF1080 domain-containing protein [Planctomycetota bacterium]|nr:DUF1080 domain-containing protein [Planctomycetota bacterium]MDA1105636.1 DUF1080 domain-containing protein [Planctomycetota bacterium]